VGERRGKKEKCSLVIPRLGNTAETVEEKRNTVFVSFEHAAVLKKGKIWSGGKKNRTEELMKADHK